VIVDSAEPALIQANLSIEETIAQLGLAEMIDMRRYHLHVRTGYISTPPDP
jgi:hypothetical protein